MYPLKRSPYAYVPDIDTRRRVEYKCRACKRAWIEHNRRPVRCPHCASTQINEVKR